MKRLGFPIFLFALLPSLCLGASPESLEGLMDSALANHPAIQTQQAQVRAAQAGLASANWQFFPTPSVAVERATTRGSDPSYAGDHTVSTLRLQQPLWTGGRLTANKEKAEASVVAGQMSLEEARQQLALRILQTYCDWLAAHFKGRANEKSVATHVRLRDQVQRRIDQGASSESDLTLALGRLQSVNAEISLAGAQKNIALARLNELVGRRIDEASLTTSIAAPRAVNPQLPPLLDAAWSANPTIKKVQAQARAQEAAITEARSDLSPEVYVRAERQYGNHATANSAPDNRVFIGLNSRFGAGLSVRSNIDSARAGYESLLAEVEVQRRAVSEQVASDHALAMASSGRVDALKAALKASGDVADSYDRQFLAGRKTWIDVMNAARELAQTEVQLADVEVSQVLASWRLAIYGGLLLQEAGRP